MDGLIQGRFHFKFLMIEFGGHEGILMDLIVGYPLILLACSNF
jgi:hypothetical protein